MARSVTKDDLDLLMRNIAMEFPTFSVVKKTESFLMKFINFVLLCFTFGKMKEFMTTFTTTVGYTVYVPSDWDTRAESARAVTLRHERVHMRQRQKYGSFVFSFLYLLVLPTIRAFYRTKFEKEAYEETLRAMVEYYGVSSLDKYREVLITHFTGPQYFWAWTKRHDIELWFDTAATKAASRERIE